MIHYEHVAKWPRKSGKADYLRFLNGENLTRAQAIKAHCYQCVAGDDTNPCLVEYCPLIDFSQWGDGR